MLYKIIYSESSSTIFVIISIILVFLMTSPKYVILSISLLMIYIISTNLIGFHSINENIDGNYKVINNIRMGPIIKVGNQHVLVHSDIKLNIGDTINIKGLVKPVKNFHGFDKITYLKTKKISSEIFPQCLSINSYDKSFFNKSRRYIEHGSLIWRKIAPMLLLGERPEEAKDIYNISKRLAILHLFVISGFHIGIIYKFICVIFKRLKIPQFDLFGLFPIILYVFILNWTIPATRALLFIIIVALAKRTSKIHLSSMDCLGIVGMFLIVMNPFIIDSFSYQITFIATTTIIYLNYFKIKNKLKKYLLIHVGVFISTFPIIGSLNGGVSIFGIFYSIAITPLISFVYVASILLLPFKVLLNPIYLLLLWTLNILNETVIIIKFNSFSRTFIYNYYIIFVICILFMEKKTFLLTLKRSASLKNLV